MPGPCILRTFPTYINLTTGPDQPKSVRDRVSNDNHNSSVYTSSNEIVTGYHIGFRRTGIRKVRNSSGFIDLTQQP